MRKIALLIALLAFAVVAHAAPRWVLEWLTAFEVNVVTHEADALLQQMEPDYLQQQCYTFHEGNTDRFLAEFFCGLKSDDSFACPRRLEDILEMRFMGMKKDDSKLGYVVTYQFMIQGEGLVEASWLLHVDGKKVMGLEGARG